MPQFDTFIFSSSLFYFILTFFILLYNNFTQILPRLGAILKLRAKLSNKSIVTEDIKGTHKNYISIFPSNLNVIDKN
jgi:DNA mismatch repair protein MutH